MRRPETLVPQLTELASPAAATPPATQNGSSSRQRPASAPMKCLLTAPTACLLVYSRQTLAHDLGLQRPPFIGGQAAVCVLGQPRLPLFVDQKHKLDSHGGGNRLHRNRWGWAVAVAKQEWLVAMIQVIRVPANKI